jgi:hypothetical protein
MRGVRDLAGMKASAACSQNGARGVLCSGVGITLDCEAF